jgi:transposase
MVRLSDAGWSIPRIAPHLGMSESCVRRWIKRFLEGGFDALPDQPHVGQSSSLTPEMIRAVRAEIDKGERVWSAAQIAEWVAQQFGVTLGADWLSRLLKRNRLSYQRTARSLKHKQDPCAVEEKALELALLAKGGTRG